MSSILHETLTSDPPHLRVVLEGSSPMTATHIHQYTIPATQLTNVPIVWQLDTNPLYTPDPSTFNPITITNGGKCFTVTNPNPVSSMLVDITYHITIFPSGSTNFETPSGIINILDNTSFAPLYSPVAQSITHIVADNVVTSFEIGYKIVLSASNPVVTFGFSLATPQNNVYNYLAYQVPSLPYTLTQFCINY